MFLLIAGLRERGHTNLLICPPHSAAAATATEQAIETRLVAMRNDLDAAAVMRLTHALRTWQPDVMHLHTGRATWLGGLAARAAGVPAITTRRMDRRVRRNWRTRLIYRRLVRRVAAISTSVAQSLKDGGVPPAMVEVIHDAVDPRRFQPHRARDALRAELGVGHEQLVVLSVAALIPRKGLDVLLDAVDLLAAQRLRPVVWLAGEGPEHVRLAQRAEELGLLEQVRFLGRRHDVPDLLAAGDVFVIASRREGMGVAALEAMAAGKPVIASAVGGLTDVVVHERTGLLVPPGDARALAAAISRMLRDEALRAQLGARGRDRVHEEFLAEQMVAAYEGLYRRVLGIAATTKASR